MTDRMTENARLPACTANGGASEDDGTAAWNHWFAQSFDNHATALRQEITDAVGEAFAIIGTEPGHLEIYETQIKALQTEVAELRGKLDAVMRIFGADKSRLMPSDDKAA